MLHVDPRTDLRSIRRRRYFEQWKLIDFQKNRTPISTIVSWFIQLEIILTRSVFPSVYDFLESTLVVCQLDRFHQHRISPWSTSNSIKMNFVNGDDIRAERYLFRPGRSPRQRHESSPTSALVSILPDSPGGRHGFSTPNRFNFHHRALL